MVLYMKVAGASGSALLGIVGVLHLSVAPAIYVEPSADAAWFSGAGVALILSAILNAMANRVPGRDTRVWVLRQVANGGTVWLAGFVLSQMPGTMAALVLIAAFLQGIGGVGFQPRSSVEAG